MVSKIFFSTILTISYFLFPISTVFAATYYVSSTGSSAGTCTSAATCTFNRAQSLSIAGDIISIQGKIDAITITKPGLIVQGGTVDGSNLTAKDSAAVMISADNTTIEDIEIINGWSYGFRTVSNKKNITGKRLNIHHNVRENMVSVANGCKTGIAGGWGSAMRAYFTDGLTLSDSYLWENCGEGFSAVMSKNVHAERLTLQDNWSVNVYPDQADTYSFTDSSIYCIKPGYNRNVWNRSFTIGAEDSYGPTTNTTKNISITNNKVYNCRGLSSYSQTTGGYTNITVTGNTIYNSYDAAIGSIPGTNIVTSPNTIITTTSPLPSPNPNLSPTPSSSPSPTPIPGDANGDTKVDGLDYVVWLNHYNQSVTGAANGDFNNSGKVDGLDYVIWVNGYGQ